MVTPRFFGKIVFITGASRGIGRSIARAFHAEGARVFGTRTGTTTTGDDYCEEWVVANFSDIAQIRSCADHVSAVEPDILINNAGINTNAPFVEIVPEVFLAIQQVNVFAPFLLCQAAIPAMVRRKWGRIVNVSSIWGKISKAQRAAYSASKFAIDGLTVALAAEHSRDGVMANSVAPGFINTELTQRILGVAGIRQMVAGVPAGRLGQPDEIARFVLWLSSD